MQGRVYIGSKDRVKNLSWRIMLLLMMCNDV